MNISLTSELEKRIAEKVSTGFYTTASEVVREALRLLFEKDEQDYRKFALGIDATVAELDQNIYLTRTQVYEQLTQIVDAPESDTKS